MRAVVLSLALCSPLGCSPKTDDNGKPAPVPDKDGVKVVKTAADLEGMNGKVVELTGQVKMASATNHLTLEFGTGLEVDCEFPARQEWMDLVGKGSSLTVRGKYDGTIPGTAYLSECERVKR